MKCETYHVEGDEKDAHTESHDNAEQSKTLRVFIIIWVCFFSSYSFRYIHLLVIAFGFNRRDGIGGHGLCALLRVLSFLFDVE